MPAHKLTNEEAAIRKARIVELRRQRRPWDAIGAEFDISAPRAYRIYREALAERPVAQVDEHRAEETELVDLAVRRLMGIAVNPQVSPRTQVEAWNAVRGFAERKAKLLGLDAPMTVVTLDALDTEIARLTAELGGVAPREAAGAS